MSEITPDGAAMRQRIRNGDRYAILRIEVASRLMAAFVGAAAYRGPVPVPPDLALDDFLEHADRLIARSALQPFD